MKNNIYLVGFMGTGKTTIGKELAKKLGRHFIDTDDLIEKRNNMSILEIYEKMGEKYFLQEEKKVAQELSVQSGKVVSTGGGTILNDEVIELMLKSGIIICLYVENEFILNRLKKLDRRPVLRTENTLEERVNELLSEREEVYKKISIKLNTTNLTPMQAADRIVDLLKTRQKILTKLNDFFIDLK